MVRLIARPAAHLLLAAALGLSACHAEPGVGASADAITHGVDDAGDPAVVGVGACTGTLIAPRVVLTAAHCVSALGAGEAEVFFGARLDGPGTRVPLIDVRPHPAWDPVSLDHDLALVLLDRASEVAPAPLRTAPIDDGAVGQPVRVVGFGLSAPDDAASFGVKRQGTTTLIGYLATTWLDDATPSSTCQGDSGGPAFLIQDGVEQLAGVASRGDAGCEQFGVKGRVDAYVTDFIQPYIDATAPGAAAVGAPCAYPEQCTSGQCATALDDPELRYCTASCGGDAACPGAMRCLRSLCRYAPPTPGAIGSACDRDADCRSGQCVAASFGGARVCTVSCEPEAAKPCPDGWSCAPDEAAPGEHACLPSPAPAGGASSGGCRMAGGEAPPRLPDVAALSLLLAGLLRRRRKARPGRTCCLAVLALTGCGDPEGAEASPPGPCGAQGAPSVELGTGPDDGNGYAPLSDGQAAPLLHGPQGGFHVWSNLRARGLCPDRLRTERVVTRLDDAQEIVTLRSQASLVPASDPELAADGWDEMSMSLPTFLCPNAPGVAIADRPIRIDLRVIDTDGRTAADARVITPSCREDDHSALCADLCALGMQEITCSLDPLPAHAAQRSTVPKTRTRPW